MTRSFSNTGEVCRYHSIYLYQPLPSSVHVPLIHLIRQWQWVYESADGLSSPATWHQLFLLCTISPSEQWEARSISQVPETYAQETLWKRPHQLGQVSKPSTHQLLGNTKSCHGWDIFLYGVWKRPKPTLTPASWTNVTFPRWPRVKKTQFRTSSPCTSHCKETLDKNHFQNT